MKRVIRVLLGILLLWAAASAILYALLTSGILLGGAKSPTSLYVVVTNTPTPLYLVVTNTPTPPSSIAVTAAPTTAPTAAPTPAPLPSATPTAALPRAVVTSDTLNARSGPGTGYPILVTLSRGDELVVTGRTAANNWLQVQLAGGK